MDKEKSRIRDRINKAAGYTVILTTLYTPINASRVEGQMNSGGEALPNGRLNRPSGIHINGDLLVNCKYEPRARRGFSHPTVEGQSYVDVGNGPNRLRFQAVRDGSVRVSEKDKYNPRVEVELFRVLDGRQEYTLPEKRYVNDPVRIQDNSDNQPIYTIRASDTTRRNLRNSAKIYGVVSCPPLE
jgi:hypothetical protein